MPATFSINPGSIIESSRKSDIQSVLQDIPDNTTKLISPKDVRDAVFSVWANSVFKQTIGTASIEYIGIDSNNPDNRDIKEKIFLGKRNFTGTDIMNSDLLSSDTDIFIFNTKNDSDDQSSTKISLLSGTNSTLYTYAPYIESKYISGTSGESIGLNIVNPSGSGPINIYSELGRIAINGIIFPSVAESYASASNGKILRYYGTYPNGSLIWDNDTVNISTLGSTGSPTTIYGSPVTLNGSSLEFTDLTPTPLSVGGINQGSTFSNVAIVDMLDRILYPYVPPTLSFSVTNLATGGTFAEAGITSSLVFSYSITRYSQDISTSSIIGTTFSSSFIASPGSTMSGTVSGWTAAPNLRMSHQIVNGEPGAHLEWHLQVSDDISMGYSYSATASIEYINPIFYSFDNTYFGFFTASGTEKSTSLRTLTGTLNKYVYPYPGLSNSYSLYYNGSGYLYFLYPSTYNVPSGYLTSVKKIKDPNGYVIYDSGTSSVNLSGFTYSDSISPFSGFPHYSSYILIRSILPCSYPGGNFEFIF